MTTETLIILGLLFLVILAVVVILFVRLSSLQKRVDTLLQYSDNKSIESSIQEAYKSLEMHKDTIISNDEQIKEIHAAMKLQFSKFWLEFYDAYGDMGGSMSFVLCSLNANNDGYLLNSLHSRSSTRLYAKLIKNGTYQGGLSDEESLCLSKAISQK